MVTRAIRFLLLRFTVTGEVPTMSIGP